MHKLSFANRQLVAGATCVAACLTSATVFADCELRGVRPAETAFNARAMAALVAALPPAPAGVVAVDAKPFDFKKPPGIQQVLCEGSKEGEFSVTARRQYVRKHSEAERKHWKAQYDQVTAQFHALSKTPPDKAAEQQVLRQQSNAAWQAMRDAEKAGDKTAAQASDAKYRSLRDQADAIDAQHKDRVQSQLSELDRRRIAIELERQQVDIVVSMNLQRLPRTGSNDTGGIDDSFGASSPGKSTGLKVHNVSFGVRGADGTLRKALIANIDRARLQSLVGKPLPSEAESEAVAANAVPTQVPDLPASALADASDSTVSATSTPATSATTPATATTAVAAGPAAPPAQPPATTPAQPPAQPLAAEAAKKAAEAANLLRGLFGR